MSAYELMLVTQRNNKWFISYRFALLSAESAQSAAIKKSRYHANSYQDIMQIHPLIMKKQSERCNELALELPAICLLHQDEGTSVNVFPKVFKPFKSNPLLHLPCFILLPRISMGLLGRFF